MRVWGLFRIEFYPLFAGFQPGGGGGNAALLRHQLLTRVALSLGIQAKECLEPILFK